MCFMPAYMENDGILSTKLAGVYNREKGSKLPLIQATVVLLDPESGSVKAVSRTQVLATGTRRRV